MCLRGLQTSLCISSSILQEYKASPGSIIYNRHHDQKCLPVLGKSGDCLVQAPENLSKFPLNISLSQFRVSHRVQSPQLVILKSTLISNMPILSSFVWNLWHSHITILIPPLTRQQPCNGFLVARTLVSVCWSDDCSF